MVAPTRNRLGRISLFGVRLNPRIGVSPGERRLPQPCEADVTLWGDFEPAANTDSLEKAVDYSRVLRTVDEAAHVREYNLVETLAREIARSVLQEFPVEKVGVRVRKRPAALSGKIDYVEVELEEE
jgi:dihydroneopterin aldolase